MNRPILLLFPLLAACGGGGGGDTATRESRATVQTADLTGLYEARGEAGQRSRMCMISEPSGGAAFALVLETPNGSCGGAGEAVQNGTEMRLAMAGDEECVVNAQIDGTLVTFPSNVSESCSYYCGSGATLAGARLEKTGGTADDARRAVDPAGDPLCA